MQKTCRWASPKRQLLQCFVILSAALCAERWLTTHEYNKLPRLQRRPLALEAESQQLAHHAWRYFEVNRLPNGLVSSAEKFPATTMWDVASQLAGMTAARELGFLSATEFDLWLGQALSTLGKLPLYRNELPNKAYNAITLEPISYGKLDQRHEIGFSALDLGRLALWLDFIAVRYPHHADASRAVTARWRTQRLVHRGYLMGVDTRSGRERWLQEGRLGYEQYAAYGFSKLGIVAKNAQNSYLHYRPVGVMGIPVASDNRTTHPNYVTSEPYVLDGIETGFRALPVQFAQRLLQVQQRRYRATGEFSAWSEDNLDRWPWFVYNCTVSGVSAWQTIVPSRQNNPNFAGGRKKKRPFHDTDVRVSSTKTAVSWYSLFPNPYTRQNYQNLRWLADPDKGVFGGVYEETQEINRSLTLNTNSQILEALFYRTIGMSLEDWVHRHSSPSQTLALCATESATRFQRKCSR